MHIGWSLEVAPPRPTVTPLPLAIHPNPDGTVTLGAMSLPAWMAADVAARLAEAASSTTYEQTRRRLAREHLDRMYARARVVAVRDMQTGAMGKALGLRWAEDRASVRLSDTVDAWLVRERSRGRGFARQWIADELAAGGFIAATVQPFVRVSIGWASVARLGIGDGR